jgi:pseudaminic acid cytidylyltransferase
MNNLAIIPARGGSKRIPGKNIKTFAGKPIIAHSIEKAILSGLFSEIMVSTDDEKIAKIALEYGAKVPFFRSEKTADDFAPLADVVEEVLMQYNLTGQQFDNCCCILPTAPFITDARIVEAFNMLISKQFDSVFPVTRFGYPIQRALKIENDSISMMWPENISARSQDLMPAYHDSGQFYWLNVSKFLQSKKIFASYSGAIVLSDLEVQDIDTEDDWHIAELKYQLIQTKA